MGRKGILQVISMLLILLVNTTSVAADETAEDITTMLTWWDEVGSEWEQAKAFIEFAGNDHVNDQKYLLVKNTMEQLDDQQQQ